MSIDSIFKYFPIPVLLNPPVIGLSFSDLAIKAVSVPRTGKHFPVKTSFIPLEKGTVVEGSIINEDFLVKQLGRVKENFKENFVSFTVPDELIYVYKTSVPFGKGENLRDAVAFTLEENVPLSVNEAVFDFKPLVKKEDNGNSSLSVVVTACARKDIDSITNCIAKSGLEPVASLPESQAIALSVIPKNQKGTSIIVHTRENRIGIYVAEEGVIQFSTLRTVLESSYKDNFLDEYKKFIEYWSSYEGNKSLGGSIYVCGDFEYAKQVVSALNEIVEIKGKPTLPNIWTNIFDISLYTPDISYEDSLSLAGAVGASISNAL